MIKQMHKEMKDQERVINKVKEIKNKLEKDHGIEDNQKQNEERLNMLKKIIPKI